MFKPINAHGFGQRVKLDKTLELKNQVTFIRVEVVKEVENENVKRLRKTWEELKKTQPPERKAGTLIDMDSLI
ncbi:hypothetical protein [Halalkalibacter krulwichiae]|uniref:Uncharacterized protein n=1 Tax=Halalkalibacter krulwichiae TaxID=199441 RepID=A0A1X9M8N5_9BACI|nr:hypothetical protein [Halalkalibacter krulwichiae]ARK29044.1 hypothetical protein BkAM31D_03820 [Halalkalibacter krulwichiae]